MIRGSIFDTPRKLWLLLATRLAQQFAIASAHQSKTALHKADGAVAQVMGFPGLFGDTFGAEQTLGDYAITVALTLRIERA